MRPIAYRLRRRALRLGGAWLAAAVAACTVGPDFERPPAPAGEAYTREPLPDVATAADRDGAAAGGDWWSGFGSPDLDATVRLAFDGNHSLAAAVATLAQAQEEARASAADLYPQATGNAGAGRQQYGAAFLGPVRFAPFTYFTVGAGVSYLIDYTGGARRAAERQGALADSEQHQWEAARLALAGNVVAQALEIASARAQIRTAEAILDDDARNLALVQSAFDAGSATRVDVLTAQSQLAGDRTLLPPLRQQLALARHGLALLVGRAPADWSPPEFDLAALALPPSVPLSLPAELARRRPDILAAEARLHAATAAVGVATADLYPRIELSASLSQQALTPGHLFQQASTAWSYGGGLTAPLFDGGRLRARRREAVDAMQAAWADYQQTVVTALVQVADALDALQHDAEQLSAQRQAAELAAERLGLARESYTAGNIGVLQVLDAERASEQAQLGYVRALAQRYADTARLILALGGASPTAASG